MNDTQHIEAIRELMGPGAGIEEIIDVIRDRIAAEALLGEGECEGADGMEDVVKRLKTELEDVKAERDRLNRLMNTPELIDFQKAIVLEAAHQRERWDSDVDAGKTDADWFWLVGYLAGKALHKPEKKLHHIITTAAVLANWHAQVLGICNMRPGVSPEVAAAHPEIEA